MPVCIKTEKLLLFSIFIFSFTVARMRKKNKDAEKALADFVQRAKIYQYPEHRPTMVWTTKWSVNQLGWPATCSCGHVYCVYGVRKDGKRLTISRCVHADGKKKRLYANNSFIAKLQKKTLVP
jgi:hypothetical protein